MKDYVKKAVLDLQKSDQRTIEVHLNSKDDYKKNGVKLIYNKLIFLLQTRLVPSHLKNALLRTTGMKVGYDACIPHYIRFDPYFPELITLDSGCLVGGLSNLISHKVKGNKLTLGKVTVGERVLLGGDVTLQPGSQVHKNSMVMLFSELDGVVPEGELWGGQPAKLIKRFDEAEQDKFFKPSNGRHKEYYRTFRKKVNTFLKDPQQTYFKIHYDGKRLNAGDDWWRARNFFRIWYNGIIIELTRLWPHSWLKILLLKIVGVKIGKGCYIGKGVVFDHIYCDTITLEDNVRLDDNVYLDGHEYTITQTIFGKILLKKGVHVKRDSFVRTGTTIGENTVIEEHSAAQREIPGDEVWGGIPAKFIRKKVK